MWRLERAKDLMRQEDIRLFWATLPETYLGLYIAMPHERPRIYLAKKLRRSPSYLLRSVAYEELGHHFTLLPYSLTGAWAHPETRDSLSTIENLALRWAARNILLPGEWDDAKRLGIATVPELAEFWDVTPELATYIVDVHRAAAARRNRPHIDTIDFPSDDFAGV